MSDNKRKQFRLWLTQEERNILEDKAKLYNYKCLSYYLRDAAIYESVIQVFTEGIDEILKLYNDYIVEVKKFNKTVRSIVRKANLSEADKNVLQNDLYKVYSQMKSLNKTINSKISQTVLEKKGKAKRHSLEQTNIDALEEKIKELKVVYKKYLSLVEELNKYESESEGDS